MNRFTKASSLLFFFTLICSCANREQPAETPEGTAAEEALLSRAAEEANVYSVSLNQDPRDYTGNLSSIIIFNETVIEEPLFLDNESIMEGLPGLEEETLLNYRETNKQKQIIQLTLSLKKPYEFIDINEIRRRDAEDLEWYRDHPIVSFSAIGFNSTFDQALVYMNQGCDDCASHNLYFLVRDKNIWRIKDILEGWIE